MSATYKAAANTLKIIEGGYCSGGLACGSAESGETYRGIDRGKNPQWTGWKLVDAYKRQYGTPKKYSFFSGTLGTQINTEVEKFWTAWWNQYGFNLIRNQYLAELLYTWCAQGPNRAMADINQIGTSFGAKKISSYSITQEVAAAINENLAKAYQDARNKIIAWYKANRKSDYQVFINTRVNIFPISISNQQTQSAGIVAAGASGSILSWLAGLFATTLITR